MAIRFGLEAGKETEALALETGLKGVPIWCGDLLKKGVDAVVEPLREKGFEVCQVAEFGYNPLHPDEARRKEMAEVVTKCLPLAREAGCPYLVVCGGNLHPSGFGHGDPFNFTDEALDRIAAELRPILDAAEDAGTSLCLEPYIKSAISTPERFVALQERTGSDRLKMNLDVTNFYDLGTMWDPSEVIRRVCRVTKEHYGLIHLKEVGLREGFHIHIDLVAHDEGPTPWDLVLAEAAPHIPEDSWVVIEHIMNLEAGRRAVKLIREAADRAGLDHD